MKVRRASSKVADENLDTSDRFHEELPRTGEDDELLIKKVLRFVVEPVISLFLDEKV